MSWEDMGTREFPCDCGKSTCTTFIEMDNWNRSRSYTIINCLECREKKETKERIKNEKIKEKILTGF